MRTASYDAVAAIPTRVGELSLLIGNAQKVERTDEALYNALCRACSVLMASQLEGFVKDLCKGIIGDFNFNVVSFKDRPVAIQREFCRRIAFFEGVEAKEIDKRVNLLMTYFGRNSVPIEMHAFSYMESNNKNPGPDVIDNALAKLGVPDAIASISGGFFEDVFQNDSRINYRVKRECVRARSLLFSFPYTCAPEFYGLRYRASRTGGPTMWHDYLDGVLRRRHTIAHGDTVENVTTWEELERDADKLFVFMHAVAFSAGNFFGKMISQTAGR